jgi:hypothetical protein
VIVSRYALLPMAAMVVCSSLQLTPAHAGWWSRGPADFEECADAAEKQATKESKAWALSQCNAKFAGRRKPGGGYTYFDFMQDRSFDIAGPNPTPEEQKKIDQEYTNYLENQRRNNLAAAAAAKQQQALQEQQQQREQQEQAAAQVVQQASFTPQTQIERERERVPLPVESPNKREEMNARAKSAKCAQHPTFTCEWPKLSEGISNIKKALFGPSATSTPPAAAPGKPKRSSS